MSARIRNLLVSLFVMTVIPIGAPSPGTGGAVLAGTNWGSVDGTNWG